MVKTITTNPKMADYKVIPVFRISTAPATAFMYIKGNELVMYTDCDSAPGGIPRMLKIIYGEYIGWVHRESLTSR